MLGLLLTSQSPWGQVQRGALQSDTTNATQTRAAKKHQGKTPQYAKNSPGCGQILKPSPSLVDREGVHGGSILSGDKQGKANPGFHQCRASHGERKARLKRKHPGGPARSQQSQHNTRPHTLHPRNTTWACHRHATHASPPTPPHPAPLCVFLSPLFLLPSSVVVPLPLAPLPPPSQDRVPLR